MSEQRSGWLMRTYYVASISRSYDDEEPQWLGDDGLTERHESATPFTSPGAALHVAAEYARATLGLSALNVNVSRVEVRAEAVRTPSLIEARQKLVRDEDFETCDPTRAVCCARHNEG